MGFQPSVVSKSLQMDPPPVTCPVRKQSATASGERQRGEERTSSTVNEGQEARVDDAEEGWTEREGFGEADLHEERLDSLLLEIPVGE